MVQHLFRTLNENQGAVIAILTLIYVVATLVLVEISRRQAKTNQQTLDFLAKVEHARIRPYVIFEILYKDLVAYASVRNTGISSALKIRFSVTPRLQWDKESREIAFIGTGLALLPPNREVSEPLGTIGSMIEMYPELKFTGAVWYEDGDGNAYEEPFFIDLTYTKTAGVISPKTTADELKGISKTLENIHETLSEPMLMRLIPENEFQRQQEVKRQEMKLRHDAFLAERTRLVEKEKVGSASAQPVAKAQSLTP